MNPIFDDQTFIAPADYTRLPQDFATDRLAENVYEITGINEGTFRVIFFDLGDGVAIFDAPDSRRTSAKIVQEIAKTLGAKPVKYVVVSHFHDDHLAGIGYYADAGVPIVTTRANAPIIARYATVSSSLGNDLAPRGVPPKFVFVENEQLHLPATSGSGLMVYRLAECPHAKDMLVTFAPDAQLLAQADIFVDLAPFSEASAAFMNWMRKPGRPDIEWIAGTHLGKISRSEFERRANEMPVKATT